MMPIEAARAESRIEAGEGNAYAPPLGPVQLIFGDDYLLVANKPPGLLSVPGRGPEKTDCLEARLAAQFGWVRAAHRLDMDTSGLMLFGRTAGAHRALSDLFSTRAVEKTYSAMVWGWPLASSGTIDLPLAADWPNRPRQKIDIGSGKPARTDWQTAGSGAHGAYLTVKPRTGRSHQLRVHLAHIGHPILGDPFYAHDHAKAAAPRLMLHAARLAFRHPVTGVPLILQAPPLR